MYPINTAANDAQCAHPHCLMPGTHVGVSTEVAAGRPEEHGGGPGVRFQQVWHQDADSPSANSNCD
jgi:hypothetical protein